MEPAGDPSIPAPRRASEWLVALREAPDDEKLRQRFDAWLAANPSHAADLHQINDTLAALGELPRARTWTPPEPARIARSRRRRLIAVLASAAVAAAALVAVPPLALWVEADHLTGVAEQKFVDLPDGSRVQLAPQSAIAVAFDDERRRVRLLKGEALFTVRHRPDRLFVVETADVKVTDIGTAFDVRLLPAGVEVAVKEGLVQVDTTQTRPPVSEQLQAGDWLVAAEQQPVERGRQLPEDVGAWAQHRLAVKNRPVSEIVAALRPWFGGVIIVYGDALSRHRLTGYYDLAHPADALRAVARAQGADVFQISPWLLILSGR
jgi:transmembrane sensor